LVPRVLFSFGSELCILLLPLFPFTTITFSARLVWLIMQCSLLFHLLAQLLKWRRMGFLHKHVLVLLLQKGMLHKGRLLFTHIFFLKWALNRRCKVPICDIAALTVFLQTYSSYWLGNLGFPLKL
jgi:hypothetical protein